MTWHEIGKAWHDTTVDYCDVCGNLLIHSYWEFSPREGQVLRACREDDERLFALLEHYRGAGKATE
jgi:hypothetical protein